MPDLEFAAIDAGNVDRIPDPAAPGAACISCDYWESLDGSRSRPTDSSWRAAKPRRLPASARLAGSYGMLAFHAGTAIGYAQFGPISAYPRAQAIRDRYPHLPESPPPYVVTCVQVRPEAGDREAVAEALLREVCAELDRRGVVAVEAYLESVADAWLPSPGPAFVYERAGFERVAEDERYPVYRIELSGETSEVAWPADLLRRDEADDDAWPLPLPKAPDPDAWPIPTKPKIRNPFGED